MRGRRRGIFEAGLCAGRVVRSIFAGAGNDGVGAVRNIAALIIQYRNERVDDAIQSLAGEAAYNRAAAALKSDKLSKADRTKLQSSLTALGAPKEANGVNVGFAPGNAIARATNGRSDIGYTKQGEKGTINVLLNNNFGTLYDGHKGKMFGKDYSRLSPRDERAGIFMHEGRHVYQNRNGMTPEAYKRDMQRYERDAKSTGKLVDKAYVSVSVYDTPED